MRHAFSLLTAIFVMLLIGSLMALALSLMSTTTKQSSDLYLKEQVQLLARSAVEYEILKIEGQDGPSATSCYNGSDYSIQAYDINSTIYYLGSGLPSSCNILDNHLATSDSNGTVIIDVSVSYVDPSSGEKIRYFRRTLQKP
jgi:type II secretory pathway pseudopilin PulG